MNDLYQRYYDSLSTHELTRRRRPTLSQIASDILPYASKRTVLEYVLFCISELRPIYGQRQLHSPVVAAMRLMGDEPFSFAKLDSLLSTCHTSLGHVGGTSRVGDSDPLRLAIRCSLACVRTVERYQLGNVSHAICRANDAINFAYFAALNEDDDDIMRTLGKGLRVIARQVDSEQIAARIADTSPEKAWLVSAKGFDYVKTLT